MCCRYGHGQRSGQIGCGKTTRNIRPHHKQKQETEREDTRSSALPSRTWNSILMSCGNRLGSWIGIRCRPCIAFALASPHSSSMTPSLLSGRPRLPFSSPQRWTDSEDLDTLYTHAVLFSLTPLNLLDAVEGREQGNYRNNPKLFVYSAMVVFVHPGQVLTTIQNAGGFFQHQYDAIIQGGHSNGWCTLCKLPCYETSQYFPVVPHIPCLVLPMLEPSGDPTV